MEDDDEFEWPILEEGETYVPPHVVKALMYIEREEDTATPRFYPGAIACMKGLTSRSLYFDSAGDAEEIKTDGEERADILRGLSMPRMDVDDPDEQVMKSVTIYSETDEFRAFLLDLMVKCASRQEAIKKEIPAAVRKMEKKRFVRQASLVAKRKGLPSDVAAKISTFAGRRKKKTRKVTKKKNRRTRRR